MMLVQSLLFGMLHCLTLSELQGCDRLCGGGSALWTCPPPLACSPSLSTHNVQQCEQSKQAQVLTDTCAPLLSLLLSLWEKGELQERNASRIRAAQAWRFE